ncbi:MAG: hypothetical protein LBR68_05035, partial [Lachnoclostridium sp.]|nr:hypothetical protein [Lachnoclostridium sp.]
RWSELFFIKSHTLYPLSPERVEERKRRRKEAPILSCDGRIMYGKTQVIGGITIDTGVYTE